MLILPFFTQPAASISPPGAMSSSIRIARSGDLGGLDIADDVMIGPNVNLLSRPDIPLSCPGGAPL